MDFLKLFSDKLVKPKEKTELLCHWLTNNPDKVDELIAFATGTKDPIKASCIEALEYATKVTPETISKKAFLFVTKSLTEKAPRIKWESAKVIGNTAFLFPKLLDTPIKNLLINAEHSGTVVRWSAAYALGEIIKLKTSHNKILVPTLESVCAREEKNSIKKIYMAAFKKTQSS